MIINKLCTVMRHVGNMESLLITWHTRTKTMLHSISGFAVLKYSKATKIENDLHWYFTKTQTVFYADKFLATK